MKLRPPATPLITCDPYFSVWSPADRLTDAVTMHWTASPIEINGKVKRANQSQKQIGNDLPQSAKHRCHKGKKPTQKSIHR